MVCFILPFSWHPILISLSQKTFLNDYLVCFSTLSHLFCILVYSTVASVLITTLTLFYQCYSRLSCSMCQHTSLALTSLLIAFHKAHRSCFLKPPFLASLKWYHVHLFKLSWQKQHFIVLLLWRSNVHNQRTEKIGFWWWGLFPRLVDSCLLCSHVHGHEGWSRELPDLSLQMWGFSNEDTGHGSVHSKSTPLDSYALPLLFRGCQQVYKPSGM